METVTAILGFVLVLVLIGSIVWVIVSILDFITEVPKQLKRIADALEKRTNHGQ